VIPDFIHNFKAAGKINMMTTGAEERQFLHTRDCARAMTSLMMNFQKIKEDGREYVDITSFEWTSIKDIATRIAGDSVTASERVDTTQTLKNEPDEYRLKFWQPEISLENGIEDLFNNNLA
jgi:nucleoside-diphosphate-sugar epimerase